MVISEETLVELDRLSKACHPAPWTAVVEGRDVESGGSFIRMAPNISRREDLYVTRDGGPAGEEHLDLIAAARTWLPELVTEVRSARSGTLSNRTTGAGVGVRDATAAAGRLVLIGYWAGPDTRGEWPAPEHFVDPAWDEDERSLVIDYLRQGQIARAYMGWSRCRLCGQDNGDLELTDGTYVWPSGLVHYVEGHDVRLPHRFVAHAEARIDSIEQAQRDEDWWRSARPEPPAAAGADDQRPRPGVELDKPSGPTISHATGVPGGQVRLVHLIDDLRREIAVDSDGQGGDDKLLRFLRSFGELLEGPEWSEGSAGRLSPLDPWLVVADALREAVGRP